MSFLNFSIADLALARANAEMDGDDPDQVIVQVPNQVKEFRRSKAKSYPGRQIENMYPWKLFTIEKESRRRRASWEI